jgi:Zn-dependent M28 family amino/carboxypeptidase
VLFVNEEPPYFQTAEMGSLVYAEKLRREGTKVSVMLALEMLGCYSDKKGSQQYPPLFGLLYPDKGNFIAFVGDEGSRKLVRKTVRLFRDSTQFPSEGIAAPGDLEGVAWSDHWSFWQKGYPAIMITDTALFRNRYYHTQQDTPEKLDYERMARVVAGIRKVAELLANEGQN